MTTTYTSRATATATATSGARPWRLRGRTRKTLLVLHIASAGVWLGIDVVMGVLVLTALLTRSGRTKALCYQALELFAVWPLLVTGLLCLATGIVLGLGGRYGLVRYWWVAVKLALNIALSSLVLVALRPTVADAAGRARDFLSGGAADLAAGPLVFPPVVSSAALVLAIVLSVFKPWGRIRTTSRR